MNPSWGDIAGAAWSAAVSAAKSNGMPDTGGDLSGAEKGVSVEATCYNAYPLSALSPNYEGIFPQTTPLVGGFENW
jgi:hypothetical protein